MRGLTVAGFVIALCAAGCFKQAQQALAPTPEGAGGFSCREIVENCDRECTDPLCLNSCTSQGTAEAAPQHAALLDCGQRNGCMDEDCMRDKCPQEIETCLGPTPAPTSEPDPADTSAPAN
jgi:hypothetical protein